MIMVTIWLTWIALFYYLTVPSIPRAVTITRVFQDGVELNWLPPTEPNGEVHYVIYYTPEGGREQSIDTGGDLTQYIVTEFESNRVYDNISVQAVNSVGRSIRSAVIEHYNHTAPGEHCTWSCTHFWMHCISIIFLNSPFLQIDDVLFLKSHWYKHRSYCILLYATVKPSR